MCINDSDNGCKEDENTRRILLQIAIIEVVPNRCQEYWASNLTIKKGGKQANEQE